MSTQDAAVAGWMPGFDAARAVRRRGEKMASPATEASARTTRVAFIMPQVVQSQCRDGSRKNGDIDVLFMLRVFRVRANAQSEGSAIWADSLMVAETG